MSRVFTCPPVLIARNQASRQNLVESTKIGRNIIDSKKTYSIEKKERKEERKHKKERKGDKSRKHSSRKGLDGLKHKQQFLESDQLEKSSLTEELEQPQNHLGYLSDGSQNSKKRKRDISPPAVESPIPIKAASVAGNPLKIRLILKKPKVDVPVLPQEDVVCSTSGTKPLSNQDVITKPEDSLPSASAVAIAETKKIKKHRPSKEDRYNALFDDWTPSSICFVDDSKDDWLFGNKTQKMLNPKTAVKIDEVMNMRLGDSSWPRAQFLPEVGIHSLPYTVPF
ncbi:hypothetical protein V5N11_025861 [Cardamine amara subsp. amara]|uniref:Uncharacterized protein n=1 Tax=Cardamine amara subsp. amara TaxID=228776 RepID=A0ABD0Z5U7_CARAN